MPEHHTRILRHALILAAERAGGGGPDGLVNFLAREADDHPVAFLNVLGKVLPLQLETKGGGNITVQIVKQFDDEVVVVAKPMKEPLTIEHKANGDAAGNGHDGSSSK